MTGADDGRACAEFKNPVARWLESRLPILSFTKVHLLDYPTPRNLNYFWTFGDILAVMLVVQIRTGIVLAATPHVDFAFDSIEGNPPRRELRQHHPENASGRRVDVLPRRLHPHLSRPLLRLLQAAARVLWMIGVLILRS